MTIIVIYKFKMRNIKSIVENDIYIPILSILIILNIEEESFLRAQAREFI